MIGARRLADAMGVDDILTADMGGTSLDVSLVREGQPDVTHRTVIERFETGLSQVDITVVGAGGGSICWLDARGAPRVGPHSAGAVPGPACYGQGGEEPTVTDVAAVLGRDSTRSTSSGVRWRSTSTPLGRRSRVALGRSAARPRRSAPQFTRIIVGNMLQAVRTVSVQRGRDPRGLAMFAYGGASGLFAAEICRGIGISRVIVPDVAAVFSASGLLAADPIRTEGRTVHGPPDSGDLDTLNGTLAEMHESAVGNLVGRGFGKDEIEVEYVFAMRFAGQTFDVDVPMEARPLTDDDRAPLVTAFQQRYAELYGAGSVWENFPMVVMTARVVARGVREAAAGPAAGGRRRPRRRAASGPARHAARLSHGRGRVDGR